MEWKLINMRVPLDTLARIDQAAHAAHMTRTAWMIAQADPGPAVAARLAAAERDARGALGEPWPFVGSVESGWGDMAVPVPESKP